MKDYPFPRLSSDLVISTPKDKGITYLTREMLQEAQTAGKPGTGREDHEACNPWPSTRGRVNEQNAGKGSLQARHRSRRECLSWGGGVGSCEEPETVLAAKYRIDQHSGSGQNDSSLVHICYPRVRKRKAKVPRSASKIRRSRKVSWCFSWPFSPSSLFRPPPWPFHQ